MKITVKYLFPIHNGRDELVPLNLSSKKVATAKQEFSTFQFTLKCVR